MDTSGICPDFLRSPLETACPFDSPWRTEPQSHWSCLSIGSKNWKHLEANSPPEESSDCQVWEHESPVPFLRVHKLWQGAAAESGRYWEFAWEWTHPLLGPSLSCSPSSLLVLLQSAPSINHMHLSSHLQVCLWKHWPEIHTLKTTTTYHLSKL